MGNTLHNGMKTFLEGCHALAGVFDHEFAGRVFDLGSETGVNFSELSSRFGISRKTGYKWRRVRNASEKTVGAFRRFDSQQMSNLALNGRNYYQLLNVIPGAVITDLEDKIHRHGFRRRLFCKDLNC